MIELDNKGDNYRIVWGLVNGGKPTSELPSHLMNHEVKVMANRISSNLSCSYDKYYSFNVFSSIKR